MTNFDHLFKWPQLSVSQIISYLIYIWSSIWVKKILNLFWHVIIKVKSYSILFN